MTKIVVITAIRNEAWILDTFLKACSEFADAIILADQNSIDASREICARFEKATLIENPSKDFNEKERIQLLIGAARELWGSDTLLVGLDADEISVNTAVALAEWQELRKLAPGTKVCFGKPDLLEGGRTYVDTGDAWQLGFLDDGVPHEAEFIHSQRVPSPQTGPVFKAREIQFLHVNLVRPNVLRAKRRMYCVLENVHQTKPLWRRLIGYDQNIDFSDVDAKRRLPDGWRSPLAKVGLDCEAILEEEPFWQDCEVLRLFKKYGYERFYWDDIWDADWNRIVDMCQRKSWLESGEKIVEPAFYVRGMRELFKTLLKAGMWAKRLIKQ